MLTYILGIASLFLAVSVMYFIKSRNKTEAVEMESRDDDASIYPLEMNIDDTKRDIRRYDDGTYFECCIHVRKGVEFPFDYDSKEDRKRVTVYRCCNSKEFLLDVFRKLDKDDLIFIEDLQPTDKPPAESKEDESGSVSKNSTEDLQQ